VFEVWDRVTGNLQGWFSTREEAEALVEEYAPHQSDLIIFEAEDDDAP